MAVERVLFRDESVEVGAFRCPVDEPDFARAGAIGARCVFVFPRTSVWIRHRGRAAFLAEPGVVTFYNPGQPYTREPLAPEGDCSDWFAVDRALVAENVRALDPSSEADPRQPFRFSHGPSDAATYLAQRRLFEAVARGSAVEPLSVDEAVMALLHSVLLGTYGAQKRGSSPPLDEAGSRDREAVREARRLLATRFAEPVTLSALARAVGLSHSRLCRIFRKVTGTTMHRYREQLRLRTALAALADRSVDLTGLALDLGYSSHSHFSARFRRAFGPAPSEVRGGRQSRI